MKAGVYNNGILAAVLEKRLDGTYLFEYDDLYLQSASNPSISLTLNYKIKIDLICKWIWGKFNKFIEGNLKYAEPYLKNDCHIFV